MTAVSDWQRPPFEPGNQLAVTHGAGTKRADVLAEQFRLRLLASEATPDYLRDPSYEDEIAGYCRCLAIIRLLWDWLAAQDVEAAMADVTTEDEDEERSYAKDGGDGSRRMTVRKAVSRHVSSVLDQIHKHETRAITHRRNLGLTPLARAAMSRDVTAAKFDLARAIAELSEREQS